MSSKTIKEYKMAWFREWKRKNPEKAKEKAKRDSLAAQKDRRENPEKYRVQNAKWRANNPGYSAAKSKEWRLQNKEKVRDLRRKWRRDNPVLMSAYRKKSLKKNWDKALLRSRERYWRNILKDPRLVATALMIYKLKKKDGLWNRK